MSASGPDPAPHEGDRAFERLFAEEIAPKLAAREDKRRATVREHHIALATGVGGGAVLAVLVLTVGGSAQFAIVAAIIAAGIGWGVGAHALDTFARQVKDAMIESLAPHLGVGFTARIAEPAGFDAFREHRLVPSFHRSAFEDRIEGEHAGARFELFEAHLRRETRDHKGRRRIVTVFRGQLLRVAFSRDFMGVTLVLRDAGVLNWMIKPGGALKRVGLVDARFEKIFEVYGSDQVEARYLLTPTFMERLLALETSLKGKKTRAAFAEGDLLIAVEGGDLFEAGSMFTPLADIERARKLRDEIAAIYEMIDVLDETRAAMAAAGERPADAS